MDNDFEKKSIRDNFLERRRLGLHIASLNAAGKVVAVDMRKGQNEMRHRLQKYRDRQREINEKRDRPQSVTMEEFLERQTRQQKLKTTMSSRPFSSPLIQRMSKLINESEFDKDEEFSNIDAFTDRQKSRVDLRPGTAMTNSSRLTDTRQYRRGAKIDAGQRDIRYYEEEEIRDRSSFYSQLLLLRKQQEQEHFKNVSEKIDQFCGKSTPLDECDTWRPMGSSLSQYSSQKYNKSWVKPLSRPGSSRPASAGGRCLSGRTRLSSAPMSKTAWADQNRIPELDIREMEHLWELSATSHH